MLASSRLGGLVSGLALAICLALPASAQLQMPTPAAPAPRAAPAVPARPAPPPKKTFQREGLASDAVRLEAALKDEAAASGPVRAATASAIAIE